MAGVILQDMPMEENPDIPVAVMYKRGDPRDVLVFPKEHILNKNINNYRVGSSSRRRELQLKMLYPGIHIESIRGNIITRLNKLDSGEYDALVLAASGLDRVNMADRISRYFSVDEMLPAAGQGILAIQARKDLNTGFLKLINDESAVYAAAAERSFVAALDGGCSSPVAAHAVIMDDELTLTGLYYDEKTKNSSIASISGSKSDAHELGIKLAGRMRK
jgi:hydroxymethylbilane synthase